MRLARVLALVVAVAAVSPATASAQQTPPAQPSNPAALPSRQAIYQWKDDVLLSNFSYRDVLSDPALMNKLSSGLWMVIAMRAYVYQEGQSSPVALATGYCKAKWELWDEVYEAEVNDSRGQRKQAIANTEGVLRVCAEAHELPIVRRDLLTAGQPYFLGVVIDVDPISPDMVKQIQQWIARPMGSTSIGPGNALFGGFVQLFTPTIPASAKTLSFRTQSFTP